MVPELLSLPPLKTMLSLPTTIGSVSISNFDTALKIVSSDLTRIVFDIRNHDYLDSTELTILDVLKISSVVGVPGVGIAATLLPYIFDILNMEITTKGNLQVIDFIKGISVEQSNIGIILADLKAKDYVDSIQLALDDALGITEIIKGGTDVKLAIVLVNTIFLIINATGANKPLNQFLGDLFNLPMEVWNEMEGKMPVSGNYVWSPLRGWILKQGDKHESGLGYTGLKPSGVR